MPARLLSLSLLLLVASCATTPSRRASTQPGIPTTRPHYADLDVHAKTSLFSGPKLPPIEVLWRGDPRLSSEPFTVRTTYYDAAYKPVTAATQPGRYGAIVEITTGGRPFRHDLTLYRFPAHVDWDYVRLPTSITFPKSFAVNNAVVAEQHENFSEFIKYMVQRDAERSSFPAIILAGLADARPAGDGFVARNGFEALDQKWWAGLHRKLDLPTLPHLVHLPKTYNGEPTKKFPLILFLHGSGEAGGGGEDLPNVKKNGIPKQLETPEGLPGGDRFIVVSPQCPPDADWSPYDLERLMEEIERTYRVDVDREYLTGLSLGGYGTWDTAIAFPKRWAAIAPMSGAGDPNDVARIKDLPCWIFHGEKDGTVPVEEARRMFAALQKVGARATLTIDPTAGHNAWNKPYRDAAFYDWLIAQHRNR